MGRQVAWLLLAVPMVALVACRKPATGNDDPSVVKPQTDLAAKSAAAQDRIAKAFHSSIVPKLKDCWGRIEGRGAVRFAYSYERVEARWVLRQVKPHASSLAPEPSEAALRCMRDASHGSGFALQASEANTSIAEMEVYWGWPLPLPEDTNELARMIPSLAGETCPKLCRDCNIQAQCESTCSGWFGCTPVSGGCQMSGGKWCQTGWSGSVAGVVMQ